MEILNSLKLDGVIYEKKYSKETVFFGTHIGSGVVFDYLVGSFDIVTQNSNEILFTNGFQKTHTEDSYKLEVISTSLVRIAGNYPSVVINDYVNTVGASIPNQKTAKVLNVDSTGFYIENLGFINEEVLNPIQIFSPIIYPDYIFDILGEKHIVKSITFDGCKTKTLLPNLTLSGVKVYKNLINSIFITSQQKARFLINGNEFFTDYLCMNCDIYKVESFGDDYSVVYFFK